MAGITHGAGFDVGSDQFQRAPQSPRKTELELYRYPSRNRMITKPAMAQTVAISFLDFMCI